MSLKIVRQDIVKMQVDAIVNTANESVAVGAGCDKAIYEAAGFQELFEYRKTKIGPVSQGEVFITPGFHLDAKYIIHAVSPIYRKKTENGWDATESSEAKLRSCYQKSLQLAREYQLTSIAFPLIATGSFGYPKQEGMRIAVDEINAFLLEHDMQVFLVLFDSNSVSLGKQISSNLQSYIDQNYVEEKKKEEYEYGTRLMRSASLAMAPGQKREEKRRPSDLFGKILGSQKNSRKGMDEASEMSAKMSAPMPEPMIAKPVYEADEALETVDFSLHEDKLKERIAHLTDTFSQYLLYLIQEKGLENAQVYKDAIVDKKTFSKIKNHPDYHPQKQTALCLCIGARLNMDETKDLLSRAGYALSPCDKRDIIFSYFIENQIYDMIELDIQLEEHGLECIIT